MPFEAGLALALNFTGAKHGCAFFEAKKFRLQQSLSDLNAYDPYIHGSRVNGVLTALLDLFQSSVGLVNAESLLTLYREVSRDVALIKRWNGNDLFREFVSTADIPKPSPGQRVGLYSLKHLPFGRLLHCGTVRR